MAGQMNKTLDLVPGAGEVKSIYGKEKPGRSSGRKKGQTNSSRRQETGMPRRDAGQQAEGIIKAMKMGVRTGGGHLRDPNAPTGLDALRQIPNSWDMPKPIMPNVVAEQAALQQILAANDPVQRESLNGNTTIASPYGMATNAPPPTTDPRRGMEGGLTGSPMLPAEQDGLKQFLASTFNTAAAEPTPTGIMAPPPAAMPPEQLLPNPFAPPAEPQQDPRLAKSMGIFQDQQAGMYPEKFSPPATDWRKFSPLAPPGPSMPDTSNGRMDNPSAALVNGVMGDNPALLPKIGRMAGAGAALSWDAIANMLFRPGGGDDRTTTNYLNGLTRTRAQ